MKIRILVLALIATVVMCSAGCIPWVSAGYEPHGSGTKIGPDNCNADYVSAMHFKLDGGASLTAEASPAKPGGPSKYLLYVGLTLPYPQSARFENNFVFVQTEAMNQPLKIEIPLIHVDDAEVSHHRMTFTTVPPLPANAGMQAIAPAAIDATSRATFSSNIYLPFENPLSFTVTLPAIFIDGHRNQLAPVRFTYSKHPRVVLALCP